jgi:hypothetical protein
MKKALPFILTAFAVLILTAVIIGSATIRPVDANGKTIDGQRLRIGWGKGKKK